MGTILGALLGKGLALLFIATFYVLGYKGFTDEGVPITSATRLRGLSGNLVGGLCLRCKPRLPAS